MARKEEPHTSHAVILPILNFETRSGRNDAVTFVSCSVQGWRPRMEDYHTCDLEMSKKDPAAYFAVFDGHNGIAVARYASEHLHKRIVHNQAYPTRVHDAIERACIILDKEMKTAIPHTDGGSTAIIVILKDDKLYCGNLGDSRAVAYSISKQTLPLSEEHKPYLPKEKARIVSAGGRVFENRVDGVLAMSRAFGDYRFKEDPSQLPKDQKISCTPDVLVMDLTNLQFIVLASDGVWDMMSSEEVCNFIRNEIDMMKEPGQIVKDILNRCLSPREHKHGDDNMTIILVLNINNLTPSYKTIIETTVKESKDPSKDPPKVNTPKKGYKSTK